MSENGKHIYECMFILDSRSAKKDLEGLQTELGQVMGKHGIEIAATHPWGERRLAYEIRRQRKGFYLLMHVRAVPGSIAELKRDLGLFEPVIRQFYLRIEAVPEKFEFPADPDDRRDGRRDFRHDRRDDRRDGRRDDRRDDRRENRREGPAEAGVERKEGDRGGPPSAASRGAEKNDEPAGAEGASDGTSPATVEASAPPAEETAAPAEDTAAAEEAPAESTPEEKQQ